MTEPNDKNKGEPNHSEEHDDLLEQADLDALIAHMRAEAPQPAPPPSPIPEPNEPDLLDQDDLDALIAGLNSETSSSRPSEPEAAPELLDQADLDALFAQNAAPSSPKEPELLDQAELDALFEQRAAPKASPTIEPANAKGDDLADVPPLLDQSELDALIAQARSAPVATPAPTHTAKPSPPPVRIDAPPFIDNGETLLDQSELDDLFASHQPAKPSAPVPPPPVQTAEEKASIQERASLDQSAIEALIAETKKDGGSAGSLDEFLGEEIDQEDMFLSQHELDELIEKGLPGQHEASSAEFDEREDIEEFNARALTDTELDAALEEINSNITLDESNLDEVIGKEGMPSGMTDQSDIDAVIAQVQNGGAFANEPNEWTYAPPSDKPVGIIEQSEIDALFKAESQDAEGEISYESAIDAPFEEQEAVGSENRYASVSLDDSNEALLSQELLDSLLQEASAKEEFKDLFAAPGKTVEPEQAATVQIASPKAPLPHEELMERPEAIVPPAKKKRFRKPLIPNPFRGFPRHEITKLAVSLFVGVLAGWALYAVLPAYQNGAMQIEQLMPGGQEDLSVAVENAKRFMKARAYADVVKEMDRAIPEAPREHPLLADAEFLRVEAMHAALPQRATQEEADVVQAAIDQVIEHHSTDPRVPQLMEWKALLYVKTGVPLTAQSIYRKIIEQYPAAPERDKIMVQASRLALELGRGGEAEEFAQLLVAQFPTSPYADEARMLLGRAFLLQKRPDKARELFTQVAQARPDRKIGAQAAVYLARMELDGGNPGAAISMLENRDAASTTMEGKDEVYLLLGQAYEANGQLDRAEQSYRDLLSFMPDSPLLPQAYVRLASVLEKQGKRSDAASLIQLAAHQYPNDSSVLQSLASSRVLSGDFVGAAQALLAADEAGANAPQLLLDAARYFRRVGEWDQAMEVYEHLSVQYPTTAQAFQGLIERAKADYERGNIRRSLSELEDLATLTEGRPQQLAVKVALGELYHDLGFSELAKQTYQEVAAVATEPKLLAQSAAALIQNGAVEQGLSISRRVDANLLDPALAYSFLNVAGQALLQASPDQGIAYMEQAHERYAEERTDKDEIALLNAYLASGRAARAQAMVMELETNARAGNCTTELFRDAALAWADYLYARRDFRAAADAYGLAQKASGRFDEDAQWASYQRAGAVLETEDYATSIPLLDAIGQTDSQWAAQARIKAAYGRAEQLRRGLPVTAEPLAEPQPATAQSNSAATATG